MTVQAGGHARRREFVATAATVLATLMFVLIVFALGLMLLWSALR